MYPTLKRKTLNLNYKKASTQYALVFLGALILALLIFVPFIIMDNGTFNFIGDYNCQQIPFYIEASESIRNGEIFWNWNTDLGVNLIGSYAFYLIGSPFFWLTLLIPLKWVAASIPFLICIKSAFAALTAYMYLSLVVKNKNLAFIGSILYAFSGFCFFNIFFNHFHDIVAFFPLLLVGMEKLLGEGKKGIMAFAVFINALTNYYFFVTEVVFCIIYFAVGFLTKRWEHLTLKRFLAFLLECVSGFLVAAFIVLPAVLTTLQINRAATKLSGWALLTYYEPQRPLQIIQGLFLPPEICSITNMLPDAGGRWSSVNAWLPLFAGAGTMTWLGRREKRDFHGHIIIILVIMAFVPALNSAFQLFSNNFYTRWFFCLVLMLCTATLKALEECSFKEWCFGTAKSAAIGLGLALSVALIKNPETEKLGLAGEIPLLWSHIIIAVICVILTVLCCYLINKNKNKGLRATCAITLVFVLLFGWYYIGICKDRSGIEDDKAYAETNIYGRWNMQTELNDGERIDTINTETNAALLWDMPTMRAFHSVVPGSIFDFYECIGETRNVKSDISFSNYAVKSLLSVKYIMEGEPNEDSNYNYLSFSHTDNGIDIYNYDHYIPMGFTYDSYITRSQLEEYGCSIRDDIMLLTLVVEDEDKHIAEQVLEEHNTADIYTDLNLARNVEQRRATTCNGFETDKNGFTATINTNNEELVFFSVPYDKGWSAQVNGEDAEILRANAGFMAVRVDKGESTIRFDYRTPGLKEGLIISAAALIGLAVYMLLGKMVSVKKIASKGVEAMDYEEKNE